MQLNTPIELLNRVGKVTASRLKSLGLKTVNDLIFYFPFRYEDFSQLKKINELQLGEVVTVRGRIELLANRRSFRKRKIVTEGILADDTGMLKMIWFNQPFLTKTLKAGDEIYLSGKVEIDRYGVQMVSPGYEKVKFDGSTIHTARLVPIYPLTAGVTEKQLRFLLSQILPLIKTYPEKLPAEILIKNKLCALNIALENIHFPKSRDFLEQAKKRLKFDELFAIQLKIQLLRRELDQSKAFKMSFLEKPTKDFVASLPFELTADQKKAAWEIIQDLGRERPMNRLLEGDVGSGKTIVVALISVNVILNGYKVVMMAPTEILAKQHYDNFMKLFKNQFRVAILTRSQKEINGEKLSKPMILKRIEEGQFDILIGTQAVIQEKIKIKDLGLVVIDEQHRFGVKQRKALIDKKQQVVPHLLSMTATPIPRSLALALFGDLDLSLIKQKPRCRLPIITRLVQESNRDKAYQFIREQIKSGRQAFVICPLIEESDKLGVKSATREFERLSKLVFPDLKIGLLHGKLKSKDKDAVMQSFIKNDIQILVSTSVIEVGIDVPNSTIMMIEGADRFGLAQLHQFRGRVGRGQHQSYCLLFTDNNSPAVIQRLNYLVECHDGFSLAEKDLKLRGAGEIYGTRQSGLPDLKLADLADAKMVELAQNNAKEFLEKYNIEDYPELKKSLEKLNVVMHFE